MYGHPPPAFRDQVTQRLIFINDFLLRGLDDYYRRTGDDSGRAAAMEMLRRYIAEVDRMMKQADPVLEQVLMDVPVWVAEEGAVTAEVFTVVGPDEADPASGAVSFLSPLGQALLLRRPGETVTISAPGGTFSYSIVAVGALA